MLKYVTRRALPSGMTWNHLLLRIKHNVQVEHTLLSKAQLYIQSAVNISPRDEILHISRKLREFSFNMFPNWVAGISIKRFAISRRKG
jgi:hypothetical protein